MPSGTILSTPTNIGHYIDTTLTGPGAADRSVVGRLKGDFKTTIAVEQRWLIAIERQGLARNLKVGNTRSVATGRKMLLDLQPLRWKEFRQTFQLLRSLPDLPVDQGGGGQVIGAGQEIGVRLVGINRHEAERPKLGGSFQRFPRPIAFAMGTYDQAILDIFQHVQDEMVASEGKAGQGRGFGRFEKDLIFRFSREEIVETSHQEASGSEGLATRFPRLPQFQAKPFVEYRFVDRVGDVDLDRFTRGGQVIEFVVVKRDVAHQKTSLESGGIIVHSRGGHILQRCLENSLC
jgi:hypothetical protein